MTLFSPDEKRQIKKIIKVATRGASCSQPLSRTVHPDATAKWAKKIQELEGKIKKILQEERIEKELRLAEMELAKAQNVRDYEHEIMSRPKKQWLGKLEKGRNVVLKNPSQKEEELLLSKFDQARGTNDEISNDDDDDDENEFLRADDGSEEGAVFSAVESDGLESSDDDVENEVKEPEKKKAMVQPGKCIITELVASEMKDVNRKKGNKTGDEKNRLQKGDPKERRFTPKQRAVLQEHRKTRAIGKSVKKAKLLKRNRVAEENSDDYGDVVRRLKAKKVKKQRKKGLRQSVIAAEQNQPKKLTRKIRAANSKYREWKKTQNADKLKSSTNSQQVAKKKEWTRR